MANYLGILWIVWVVLIIVAILLAINRARRAMKNRNASQPTSYTVYTSPGSYPPRYLIRSDSTEQPNPLAPMYYGAPYPEPSYNEPSVSSSHQKPDSNSIIDIPPPSYQDHSKDLRLPKPV
ncbi:hypothetical protein BGW37DRAFT_470155 [Umbelopsis sp. PMI_123]|nr:hypothetical protein BGW37DRAFT_470155 [Umbelopsis sp. PMI_123]